MQSKLLLLSAMILGSLVVALTAGIVQVVGGGRIPKAVQSGGLAFVASMTLGLLIVTWLGPI
jgi:hypothetical protein